MEKRIYSITFQPQFFVMCTICRFFGIICILHGIKSKALSYSPGRRSPFSSICTLQSSCPSCRRPGWPEGSGPRPWTIRYGMLNRLLYLLLNKFKRGLSPRKWAQFTFLPFSQYLLMYDWLDEIRQTGSGRLTFLALVIAVCAVMDTVLFAVVFRMTRRRSRRRKTGFSPPGARRKRSITTHPPAGARRWPADRKGAC